LQSKNCRLITFHFVGKQVATFIKLFSLSLMKNRYKLERLSPGSLYSGRSQEPYLQIL
jgi:hypothetical protein